MARGITEDEENLLAHVVRWGSAGYPIRKLGRGWVWGPFRSVQGPPIIFKTKREATAHLETLRDARAGRI